MPAGSSRPRRPASGRTTPAIGSRPQVTVALPEPELIAPLNEAPAGVTTLVPWGSAIQVLKEEDHFDILCNHVPPEGVGLLLVSLHKAIRTLKNGTERPFVEVRLDGERVGELSNVTSAHLVPLLEHTETIGETALAYAKNPRFGARCPARSARRQGHRNQ